MSHMALGFLCSVLPLARGLRLSWPYKRILAGQLFGLVFALTFSAVIKAMWGQS